MPDQRLQIHELSNRAKMRTLAEDARDGLTATPKTLPPKYFYDAVGSSLFDVITLLPEYYATRAETEILQAFAAEIVAAVKSETDLSLLEFGSGSAIKTRILIEAILAKQAKLKFIPSDISPSVLEDSSRVLLQLFAGLTVEAYAADYFTALAAVKLSGENRVLALFLGSNIGNFTPPEAREFLTALRQILKKDDCLLLGADLKKDRATLENAYDDPTLVTAAFNLNLLARLNRELDADFNLRQFQHQAVYNEQLGRVEMHLQSLTAQTVTLRKIDLVIEFAENETIHTENSHKFAIADLAQLASENGFRLEKSWFDQRQMFSSNLFVAL